jgi:hypothetical membrane protein
MRFSHASPSWLAAVLWISSIQYFIVQLIVIAAWPVPHSFAHNFISDLGNTECGTYAGLVVCSPLHLLMNISFVTFGLTMAIGAMRFRRQLPGSTLSKLGLTMMIAAGIGTIMVGVFPENTIGPLHVMGAILGLGVGNLSVLLIGLGLQRLHPAIKFYTIASGIVSLGAFVLFTAELYAGLGRGGMERLISYPFTLWMIIFGIYMLMRWYSRGQ